MQRHISLEYLLKNNKLFEYMINNFIYWHMTKLYLYILCGMQCSAIPANDFAKSSLSIIAICVFKASSEILLSLIWKKTFYWLLLYLIFKIAVLGCNCIRQIIFLICWEYKEKGFYTHYFHRLKQAFEIALEFRNRRKITIQSRIINQL